MKTCPFCGKPMRRLERVQTIVGDGSVALRVDEKTDEHAQIAQATTGLLPAIMQIRSGGPTIFQLGLTDTTPITFAYFVYDDCGLLLNLRDDKKELPKFESPPLNPARNARLEVEI